MLAYEKRIKEVASFFENKDTVLGFRKLMDCAIDTQNLDIYNDVISLTDWNAKNPEKGEEFITKSLAVLDKISKFPVEASSVEKPIIMAKEITKSYKKRSFTLGPISMEIRKGEVYGLVGENGNGKTTLLRTLAKELQHDSGSIDYNFDKTYKSNYDLRTKLVYIPQRTAKWYGSLQDNLKFVLSNYGVPGTEIETRILMMIARFGLWNYKDLKWRELSSGYKMRFELARTMLRQPELLLLDEPLANLDVLAQQVILEDLKSIGSSINNPVATILSSQQLYEVEKVSDKVIFLKNGKYSDNNTSVTEENNSLIVEIDSASDRESLIAALADLKLEKLTFNGGIYFAYFNEATTFSNVLKTLGEQNFDVVYLRDISKSTRRFFVS